MQWENAELCSEIFDQRPHLFSDAAVFMSAHTLRKQNEIILAIEHVIALPTYQQLVLAYAPSTASFFPKAKGVFFGYDFHLGPNGPQLIEINSNAGGALLCAIVMSDPKNCSHYAQKNLLNTQETAYEQIFLQMFLNEWQAERGLSPLSCIAIVDQNPQEQFLYPEFLLFKRLFESHGIEVIICDPTELIHQGGKLWHDQKCIDMVYNRLTDFSLESSTHQQLCEAYLAGSVVLTPHPLSHALYADKRNLAILTDESSLVKMGVDVATRATLQEGIAHTIIVKSSDAETLWHKRKQLFFKPAKGYGSKATYRGDKMTLRVFDEILHNENDYVAQVLVPPAKRNLQVANKVTEFKFDLRMYVYRGQTQLAVARLYQGQTTNFRTPGGGFARVVVVETIPRNEQEWL